MYILLMLLTNFQLRYRHVYHTAGGGMTVTLYEKMFEGLPHITMIAADSREKLMGQGCAADQVVLPGDSCVTMMHMCMLLYVV